MEDRRIVVSIATSADGFIARPDGDMAWLTDRAKPAGFYGLGEFVKTIDTKVLGRKTFDQSLRLGARFGGGIAHYVFSRLAPPAPLPPGVAFVSEDIGPFAARLRSQPGKDIWLMGGGGLIASFLDAGAIDELVVSVIPISIGDGIPLFARRHRDVELETVSAEHFPDGVVQVRYRPLARPNS